MNNFMNEEIKTYQKYPMPKDSAWDRKSYDLIVWLYHLKDKEKEHPKWLENYFFDPYFSAKNWIKYFFVFIVKLFKWIPILWKDRDYDDSFIFDILKKKIHQQRDFLVKNNRHSNIEQTNHWMTVCLNLIERIQGSYYEIEHFEYEEVEHHFIEITKENEPDYDKIMSDSTSNKLYRMEREFLRDNLIDYIDKYPLDRDKTIKFFKKLNGEDLSDYATNQENRSTLCTFMSKKRHEKAIKVLFLVLAQKIEAWWD
jgi:hypothetical protein